MGGVTAGQFCVEDRRCKAGLNLETVMKSVTVGAAGSKALEVLGPRILKRDFEPGFYVERKLPAGAKAVPYNYDTQVIAAE